jgi:DNA-binding helix-hairpin-helix protein with protein kinase domain
MPEKCAWKARSQAAREEAELPIRKAAEKTLDALELFQLEKDFKRGVEADYVMTPEVAALFAQAEALMDEEKFTEAGDILHEISKLIVAKYQPWRRKKPGNYRPLSEYFETFPAFDPKK